MSGAIGGAVGAATMSGNQMPVLMQCLMLLATGAILILIVKILDHYEK